eukprot:gene711-biopygen1359
MKRSLGTISGHIFQEVLHGVLVESVDVVLEVVREERDAVVHEGVERRHVAEAGAELPLQLRSRDPAGGLRGVDVGDVDAESLPALRAVAALMVVAARLEVRCRAPFGGDARVAALLLVVREDRVELRARRELLALAVGAGGPQPIRGQRVVLAVHPGGPVLGPATCMPAPSRREASN